MTSLGCTPSGPSCRSSCPSLCRRYCPPYLRWVLSASRTNNLLMGVLSCLRSGLFWRQGWGRVLLALVARPSVRVSCVLPYTWYWFPSFSGRESWETNFCWIVYFRAWFACLHGTCRLQWLHFKSFVTLIMITTVLLQFLPSPSSFSIQFGSLQCQSLGDGS